MQPPCDYHETTRELIGKLDTRVSLAEQKAEAAQEDMRNMENQITALTEAVSAQTTVLNKIGWAGGLAAGALGLLVTFHDHLVKLLGI